MTPSTCPTEQHLDKQQQRSIISSFLRDELDELMASGLMPRPSELQPVDKDGMPVMAVYLPRPSTHKHRVQWPLPSTPGQETNASGTSSSSAPPQQQLSEPCYGTLCSKHSRQGAYVYFHNTTPHTVRLMWIDYKGQEVAYDTLLPGGHCIQQTFATHPWVAREVSTATSLPINMQEGFCPLVVKFPPPQRPPAAPPAPAPAGAPAPAPAGAPAAAPAGPQDAAAAGAAGQVPQPLQPQLLQQEWVTIQGPHMQHRVPMQCVQRAEITQLPALAWSPETHPHFPPGFKAAVKAFLLCHAQLQQSVVIPTEHTHCAAGNSHLGCIPSALLPVVVGMAAPYSPQHMELPLALRPDVLPTCLAEDPEAPLPPFADDPPGDNDDDEDDEWMVAAGDLPGAGAAAAGAAAGGAGGDAAGGAGAAAGGAAGNGYVPLADEPVMDEEDGEGEAWEEAESDAMEQ